jgi:hypothetical protein
MRIEAKSDTKRTQVVRVLKAKKQSAILALYRAALKVLVVAPVHQPAVEPYLLTFLCDNRVPKAQPE